MLLLGEFRLRYPGIRRPTSSAIGVVVEAVSVGPPAELVVGGAGVSVLERGAGLADAGDWTNVKLGVMCQDVMADWLVCMAALENDGLHAWNDNVLDPIEGPCSSATFLYFDFCPGVWLAPGALPQKP